VIDVQILWNLQLPVLAKTAPIFGVYTLLANTLLCRDLTMGCDLMVMELLLMVVFG
jgi:hypothetical protein